MTARAFGRRVRTTEPSPRPGPSARAQAVPEQAEASRQRAKGAADIVAKIHATVVKSLDMTRVAELDNETLATQLLGFLESGESGLPDLGPLDRQEVVTQLVHDIRGLGPIEPLLLDSRISDILINGMSSVYVERGGRLEPIEVRFRDAEHLLHIAQRIAGWVGRRVDESSPMVDARLPDGSRVNIIIPPLAIDGAAISIRRFTMRGIGLEEMAERAAMSSAMAELFRVGVKARLNILVSGGTGSGKTTFMNALSREIPHSERLVTIEDAAELQLQQPHVVRLETRTVSAEGTVEVGDGESIVIGGLFRSAENEVESGVPLLKDAPLLGPLFGHTSSRSNELELIVAVTARLVSAGPSPNGSGAQTGTTPNSKNDYHY